MALTGQPTHSMQLSSTRPCCKRCWFRQSRPRLSRTLAIAQKSNSERRPDKAQHTEQGQANSNAEAAASVKASRGSVAQAAEQNGEDRLAAYGDRQASAETNGLLSAVDEIRQASQAAQSSTTPAPHVQQQSRSVSSPASPESSSQPTQQASGSSEPLQGPGPPTKSLSKADTLAKLAQAKAYKQDKSREGGTPAILDTKAITQQPIDPSPAPVQPTDSFSSTQRRPQQPTSAAAGAQDFANHPENNAENGGIGIAARPARFLEQAMQKQSEDSKKMSEEAYSLLKEKQKRSQKVDIISVDKSYNKGNKVMDPAYSPKIATWGVFERPANISETYGGGRTIKAGSPLEDPAVTQARKDRLSAALSRYKRDAALEIDPAELQKCQAAFAQGEELFTNKKVAAALMKYAVAAELMPIKTALGGRARLQQALCLDSLGQNKEAYTIYLLIQTHPLPEVAKQAKRMIFGFKAMDNLKAHTISYSVSKGAYEQYFNRFTGDWNSSYVSTDEDDSSEVTKTAIIACAVMLAPIAFLVARIVL